MSKGITPQIEEYKNCFPDVKEQWFAPYVCYAKSADWVHGYGDGEFKPTKTVSKAEMFKILLNSQGVVLDNEVEEKIFEDVYSHQWFAKFISTAKEMGLLHDVELMFEPDEAMDRGLTAEYFYRLLMYINKI